MSALTHKDTRKHGTRRVDSGDLWWIGYFRWTDRVYYLWGVPIWVRKIDEEERPITELIKRAFGA